MKINTKQTTTKEFVLDQKEATLVKSCLDYCWHRLVRHNNSGIEGIVHFDDVDKLRKGLDTYSFDFSTGSEGGSASATGIRHLREVNCKDLLVAMDELDKMLKF